MEPFISDKEKKMLLNEGLKLWIENPIQAVTEKRYFNSTIMSKVRAWRHNEYDKIILMDADVFALKNNQELFHRSDCNLCCQTGVESPINGGILIIRPSKKIYRELIQLILWPNFSLEQGWRQHGKFEWKGKTRNWDFNCAGGEQGLLFYYFHLLKDQLKIESFQNSFLHIGRGNKKWETIDAFESKLRAVGMYDAIKNEKVIK